MEKRNKKVNVRLTESEYNYIKKFKELGLKYSDIFYMGMHYCNDKAIAKE